MENVTIANPKSLKLKSVALLSTLGMAGAVLAGTSQPVTVNADTTTPAVQTTHSQQSQASTQTADQPNYTVKAGDTLWDLAQTYHTSVDQLKKDNHLDSDLIVVGQKLVIKGANGYTSTSAPSQNQVSQQASSQTSGQTQAQSQTQATSYGNNGGSAYSGAGYTVGMNDNAAANAIAQAESGGSYTAQNGRLA